ncbi:protein MpGUN4 [Marchantia polymorpha subsp. ruderalis]|uniref:GUN4-like domain-containing protein n=2 Tax=Marchantia polymorpha TaxID=3197 RepID=A0AAF6BP93_MARPO|nr:hypothetical protein MARPO_0173s0019 [Marchantia polymorpha]BBN13827.1 hypothetical protein Mp_6g06740 [Marchantia polymorpha subsp. ruderalis]|eukprot:PTQ28116.1 hypothetical protein MARPO_0173s0019 [Marchantia polymorpha]
MEAVMLLGTAGVGVLGGSRAMPQRVQCVQIAQARCCNVRLRVVAASATAREATVDVALESELGVSYELLRDKLAAGEWEAADAETRRLLCVMAGEGAVKRKWVYFSEVQFIPEADLRTVDGLWRAYSNQKFGYSVQRRVWKSVNESWTAFFKKVGWTRQLGDSRNDAYKKFPLEFMWDVEDPTPRGHLPLTNALRGTQLIEKLLLHPAFAFADEDEKLMMPEEIDMSSEGLMQNLKPKSRVQQNSPPSGDSPAKKVLLPEDMSIDYGF